MFTFLTVVVVVVVVVFNFPFSQNERILLSIQFYPMRNGAVCEWVGGCLPGFLYSILFHLFPLPEVTFYFSRWRK